MEHSNANVFSSFVHAFRSTTPFASRGKLGQQRSRGIGPSHHHDPKVAIFWVPNRALLSGLGAILWQYFVYCCNSHVTIVQHHYHDNLLLIHLSRVLMFLKKSVTLFFFCKLFPQLAHGLQYLLFLSNFFRVDQPPLVFPIHNLETMWKQQVENQHSKNFLKKIAKSRTFSQALVFSATRWSGLCLLRADVLAEGPHGSALQLAMAQGFHRVEQARSRVFFFFLLLSSNEHIIELKWWWIYIYMYNIWKTVYILWKRLSILYVYTLCDDRLLYLRDKRLVVSDDFWTTECWWRIWMKNKEARRWKKQLNLWNT